MELACALVLLVVGSVTAGPYGYGTKGGAAAKADARAVAGAYAGAGSIPLSIPNGSSYTGSFSQSASSSASSSSASSSSFSYSGSGVTTGGKGCGSGNCNAGGATGSQGSPAAGTQAYSGANAGSITSGYGGKIPTSSYGHKYGDSEANKGHDCGSQSCQGTSDLNTSNLSGAGIGSQSSSGAKAAASAGAGRIDGSECGGSDCNNIPDADKKCVSGQCGSKAKCSSGDCGTASDIDGTPSHIDDSNKCTSGQCGSNQGTDGSSSSDSETNDINVHASGDANSKSSFGANKPGCSNGNCGDSPAAPGYPEASGYNKPALDLIAPKLDPSCSGYNCHISQSGYSSSSPTKAPFISTGYQNENQLGHVSSPDYGSASKPIDTHGSSYSPVKPFGGVSCAPGTPGCDVTAQGSSPYFPVKPTGGSSCAPGTSGCGVTAPFSGPSTPGYDGLASGTLSYSHGSKPLVNPSGPDCAPGTPGCLPSAPPSIISNCASGNCGTNPSLPNYVGAKPSYAHGGSPLFSSVGSSCAPGTPGCSTAPSSSKPTDCGSGNCGGAYPAGYSSSFGIKPSFSHGSSPSLSSINPSGPACIPGSPGCTASISPSGTSGCASGNCGGPLTSTGHNDFSNNPSYTYGNSPSHSSVNPSSPGCTPGSPGCTTSISPGSPSGCASGNCNGPHSGFSNNPSYSHGHPPSYSSVYPSGPDCALGSPGCATSTLPSGSSGCASGNCGGSSTSTGYSGFSKKPSYSSGGSPSYFPSKPSGPGCAPGTPGCSSLPSVISSPSYNPVKPIELPCAPGTPGCSTAPPASGPSGCVSGNNCEAYPSAPEYGASLNINPNYSQGGADKVKEIPSFSTLAPSGSICAPGSPGCALSPTASGPSGCTSGNCGNHPISAGGGTLVIKPSYAYGSLSAHSQLKPAGPACAPGSPGCALPLDLSGPSTCTSGNCDEFPPLGGQGGYPSSKPSYSQGSSSYFPVKPSGQGCAPGAPGCAIIPSLSSPSGCTSGNCGTHPISAGGGTLVIKPSYAYESLSAHSQVKPAGPVCAPGSPGCALPLAPSGPSACTSGNCDEFPPIGGQGGFPSSKPSYSQGSSSYFPVKPSGPGCAPGAPGCAITPSLSSPSGCTSGNCGAYPSPQGCAPGSPGCSGSSPVHSGASGLPSGHATVGALGPVSGVPSYGTSLPSGPTSTAISTPGYGASGIGSSSHQAVFGTHGTGSLQTSFIKPSTGFPTGSSGSGAYTPGFSSIPTASSSAPGIGSSPHLGTTFGVSGQHGEKENLPAYTGGFGGPTGILKPNEYNFASASSFSNKPIVSTVSTTVKPGCVSGVCNAQASPSLAHSGAASGALATAGASASANAVAYTGGFGGPPGLLKPYDNGKADGKETTGLGSSLHSHQGVGGSGYLSGGSQVGGNAVAQANAAAVSSAGANSGNNKLHSSNNGGYGHGHDSAGGCEGGCGGSDSDSLGYNGSLGLSKTGGLDDSSNGLAAAGAVAKSVANASSGARAFGGSYASSSATAHAGASVKGGYGRR